jgi:membrane-anchored protein YejM (alkaline phosphatase superfamily)
MFPTQPKEAILFITLDSCRYDTFAAADVPNLKAVGELHRAMSPGYFTYSSHMAMFMGFTPGISQRTEPYVNPKFGKIFKMIGSEWPGKGIEHFTLSGSNVIDGLKRINYFTIGSGAVRWFDDKSETGRRLTGDFQSFYYPGNVHSLGKQLSWIENELQAVKNQPVFVFLNIGETHAPYYYEGADWSYTDNPCSPFSPATNNLEKCRTRQRACLEFVDGLLAPLLKSFENSTILLCADHGDAWGEDGLWEHGVYHEKIMEVPLLFRLPDLADLPRVSSNNRFYDVEISRLSTIVSQKEADLINLSREHDRLLVELSDLQTWAVDMEQRLRGNVSSSNVVRLKNWLKNKTSSLTTRKI